VAEEILNSTEILKHVGLNSKSQLTFIWDGTFKERQPWKYVDFQVSTVEDYR